MKDDYKIVKELGKGGMSRVFLAVDRRIAKKWTIKEIDCNEKDYILKSICHEVELLKKIRSVHISKIADVYTDKNKVYLVMEYIEGNTLEAIIRSRPCYASKMALKWSAELADIFYELHNLSSPVIYRDCKPSNIIVRADGSLCLIDFGASKIKSENPKDLYPTGTKRYAAPEQLEGFTDELTDIYSYGKTIERFNSKNPFLYRIIRKCTSCDRRRRSRSFQKIVIKLRAIIAIQKYGLVIIAFILLSLTIAVMLHSDYNFQKAAAESYQSQLTAEKLERLEEIRDDEVKDYIDKLTEYRTVCSEADRNLISYKAGLKSLFTLHDYEGAYEYFADSSEENFPEIKYLKDISKELSSFSDEADRLYIILKDYKKYIDTIGSGERRGENLIAIAKLQLMQLELSDNSQNLIADELLSISQEIKEYDEAEAYDISYLAYKAKNDMTNASFCCEKWLESNKALLEEKKAAARIKETAGNYADQKDYDKALNLIKRMQKLFPNLNKDLHVEYIKITKEREREL